MSTHLNMMRWKPKDIAVFLLIFVLLVIIAGDVTAPKYTSIEHFKMLDEIIGATVSGILLVISNYFNSNGEK